MRVGTHRSLNSVLELSDRFEPAREDRADLESSSQSVAAFIGILFDTNIRILFWHRKDNIV